MFDSNKNEKKRIRQSIFLGLLLLFVLFKSGVLSNSTWHVPETEESHANSSRVVDCFIGEIHHSRETGPPEQRHREVRRALPQSKPSAAPQKITRPSQNPVFHPSLPRKPHEHQPGHEIAQTFDRCIPVAACVGLRGGASHPRHLKSDSLFYGAGRNNRPLPAAPRGGRGRLLASVDCLLVFVDACALFGLKK